MASTQTDPLDFATRPAPATAPPPPRVRHPLGLPPGSVRAFIALLVAGLVWALILQAPGKVVELPLYLCYLLFLIFGSFFAAHGNSIAGASACGKSPWHLPCGTMRLVLVLGFAAVIGWKYHLLGHQFPEFKTDNPGERPYLLVWILGAFFGGILVNRFAEGVLRGPQGTPAWYQDVLAWLSLLAVLGLAVEVVILFMINPALEGKGIVMPAWEAYLATVISFYFGARS